MQNRKEKVNTLEADQQNCVIFNSGMIEIFGPLVTINIHIKINTIVVIMIPSHHHLRQLS